MRHSMFCILAAALVLPSAPSAASKPATRPAAPPPATRPAAVSDGRQKMLEMIDQMGLPDDIRQHLMRQLNDMPAGPTTMGTKPGKWGYDQPTGGGASAEAWGWSNGREVRTGARTSGPGSTAESTGEGTENGRRVRARSESRDGQPERNWRDR